MLNERFEGNATESNESQLIKNLTEGVITTNNIDPSSINLVAVFGSGYEKDNRHAILYWVIETINGEATFPERPLPRLNQYFKDRLDEISEGYY